MNPAAPPPSLGLKEPELSIGEASRRAAIWALLAALVLFAAFVGWGLVQAATSSENMELIAVAWRASKVALSCLPFLFFFRLLWWSRTLLSRSFAAAGLLATFLGLAVLVILFVRLGIDVAHWLETMPERVREKNIALADKVDNAQANLERRLKVEVDEAVQRALDRLNQQEARELRDAANDQEKELIRKDYEGRRAERRAAGERSKVRERKEFEANTLNEMITERDRGTRPDTSAPAMVGHFLTSATSGEPQDAGVLPALIGSLYLALITVLCAVPIGVGAAIYLEEYKQAGWFSRLIELNIRNLAGVPSIVYGILGAFVFVEMIFKPVHRSYAGIDARNTLGGGLTLALLTLPIVITAAQEAIRAVPQSIRHGALALGATRWQVVRHHVLPNAAPGILTGTILAVSRTLGEAAPLVLFGCLLYKPDVPTLFSDFTAMPTQIFKWADESDIGWKYNAAFASVVLVITLLVLNAFAIWMRNRAQKHLRW